VFLGGILPIAVPWFGALGAVTISLEGVFLWNSQWDKKYNYWHIGRPVVGAVLGIVAFFLFVLIVTASGTPPKFLTGEATGAKDFIIYYMVAFLVGYREETFRDLIKRATDVILQPGTQPPSGPAVTFKIAGVTSSHISFPRTTVGTTSRVAVEVQNVGSAPLIAPAVAVAATAPAPVATFGTANDRVTGGGDLAPGQVRTVDVTFTPQAAGNLAGTLTVSATSLTAPKAIGVSGTAQ
jgi:Abnormal spindle-like microcephaly-assoc'd, ASPM-SPD-2-Hydin